ncbi:MAG: antibiotic biosynthesis monooxygenase [Aliivibrio sp.]|uniref:putative quinol monooxygenase n=1 Tax=Aliivibrio sp. TaxID=1872443 RepID=UPI001A3A78FD|nr:antibiotic biosynthesis monooxygenase [Aliivibrio sp.]
MGILVHLEANAKPECVSEMSESLATLFPETRVYDGCIDITAYLNDDGHTFIFTEHWETKEQYEKYLAWRQETGVLDKLVSLLQEPPTIRYFEAVKA